MHSPFKSTIKWKLAFSVAGIYKKPSALDKNTFTNVLATACISKMIRREREIQRKEQSLGTLQSENCSV